MSPKRPYQGGLSTGEGGDWRDAANCLTADPELFFFSGSETTPAAVDQIRCAKKICQACTVIAQCLEYALTTNQAEGIWGGTTPEERRKMKRAATRRALASRAIDTL